jgi:hypothetical protein
MRRSTVIDMEAFKRLAKLISRRLEIAHSKGLEQLSIASGYQDWHALHREYERMMSGDPVQRSSDDFRSWIEQVVEVFGPNARSALPTEDVRLWYHRAFGPPARDEDSFGGD